MQSVMRYFQRCATIVKYLKPRENGISSFLPEPGFSIKQHQDGLSIFRAYSQSRFGNGESIYDIENQGKYSNYG